MMDTNPNPEPAEPLVMSIEEAGHLLGLKRTAAYDRAREGAIPTLRLGRRLVVPRPALMRMLGGE